MTGEPPSRRAQSRSNARRGSSPGRGHASSATGCHASTCRNVRSSATTCGPRSAWMRPTERAPSPCRRAGQRAPSSMGSSRHARPSASITIVVARRGVPTTHQSPGGRTGAPRVNRTTDPALASRIHGDGSARRSAGQRRVPTTCSSRPAPASRRTPARDSGGHSASSAATNKTMSAPHAAGSRLALPHQGTSIQPSAPTGAIHTVKSGTATRFASRP